MSTNKHIKGRCGYLVAEEGGRMQHYCNRVLVDGDGCRIHCKAAREKREAKSAVRYEEMMKPKQLAWANQALGSKVRDIVDEAVCRPRHDYVDLLRQLRNAIEEVDQE